jgi:hypothetical protein
MIVGQGDVTLTRIGDSRASADPKPITIAIGEQSGHSHVLRLGIELREAGKRLVDVPQDTQIDVVGMPWRHTAITIPAGLYGVIDHQVEYTPAAIVRSED